MAVITPDTFDPLHRYVGVRLQQGVPIVDADWNELEDVRKFELRVFLKWFVGDGVPEENDGFQIEGTGLANDFIIRAGISGTADGLSNVGRCLVDGLDVMIEADTNFTTQPLHEDNGTSADAEATRLGVPKIEALTTPTADGTVVVYLDVWERIVTPTEDPGLVHPGLGTESCVRIKREWVVRVRDGTSVPVSGDSDYLAGHSYYALATIARRNGDDTVNAGDVTDLRQTILTLADVERRLSFLEELVLLPSFAPSPNQFTPKMGWPGQNVTLFGSNFNVGTPRVQFGTVDATIVGTPTATEIVATVPAGVSGGVKIKVITDGGTAESDDTFTVIPPPPPSFAPSPNQFTPKMGAAGVNVTLFGNNFNVGTPKVQFGTVDATIVGTPSATEIVAEVPTGVTGGAKITVTTNGGTVVSDDTFTVL